MKNKLAICSYFGDSVNWGGIYIDHVNKFFNQIKNQVDTLNKINQANLNPLIVVLENKSKDETESHIRNHQKLNPNITFIKFFENYEEIKVASVASEKRYWILSLIGNTVLETAKCFDTEYILWVESDLLMPDPETLHKLISKMDEDKSISILSPIIFINHGKHIKRFYDTWGYECSDGSKWINEAPYHRNLQNEDQYLDMNSVGSCALMRREALQGVNFGKNCFVELCKNVKKNNGKILLDKNLEIYHPAENGFVNQRWV
jgi:GT2 family glycosyltransferase